MNRERSGVVEEHLLFRDESGEELVFRMKNAGDVEEPPKHQIEPAAGTRVIIELDSFVDEVPLYLGQ